MNTRRRSLISSNDYEGCLEAVLNDYWSEIRRFNCLELVMTLAPLSPRSQEQPRECLKRQHPYRQSSWNKRNKREQRSVPPFLSTMI